MNNTDFENLKGVVNDDGVSFEQQYFKREVTPKVIDGKVPIPVENNIRNNYGEDFVNEYKRVVKHAEASKGDLNHRGTLVNLSSIIRKKQGENKTNTADEGGHVSEIGAAKKSDESFKIEDEGGHTTVFSSKDEAKEYYLRILRRRLDLISKKYNIQFDKEFVDFFESDEFFVDGKVPNLEEYKDLEAIDKAWNTADIINDLPNDIDKTIEDNYKAMQVVKNTALLYGDKALYDSVIDDSKKIDDFLEKSRNNAIRDQKFFNEQKVKEKVETAILGIVSHKVQDNPELQEVIDVVKDAINKRTDYMREETKVKQYERNIRVKEVQAESLEAAKEFKSDHDRVVDLLDNRRDERETLVFSSKPSEIKREDGPIFATANPVNNYVEPIEREMGGKQLVLTKKYNNPINKEETA